jgi:general secretion pathway protein N
MKRAMLWAVTVLLTVALTVLVCLPAAMLGPLVEAQTGGRLTLGDAQGTLWRGSAFVGGAPGPNGAVTPLLPGRFSWQVSPLVLLGQVDLQLDNPDALSQPVTLRGGWSQWQVSPAMLALPADNLAGLGAPLNTMAPSGKMALNWTNLAIERRGKTVAVTGHTALIMTDMSSRLSPLKPLGSYALAMDWRGASAQLTLSTVRGPLLLDGQGAIENGRLRFAGSAQAAHGFEDSLGNLLNLLGQRRMVGDKNIIALEFK